MPYRVTAIFEDPSEADPVMDDLQAAKFGKDEVGTVMSERTHALFVPEDTTREGTSATVGGVVGMMAGSIVALATAPAFLVGGAAVAFAGAVAGLVGGGMAGAFAGMGFGYERVEEVKEAVEQGAVLVTVDAASAERAGAAADVLSRHHPAGNVDVIELEAA